MSMLGSFVKQPAERESYTITYEDDLTTGDNVASAVVAATPTTDPVLTVDPVVVDDPQVRMWVSGGVVNTTYKITVTTTTNDGRILQDEFKIKVKDI